MHCVSTESSNFAESKKKTPSDSPSKGRGQEELTSSEAITSKINSQ